MAMQYYITQRMVLSNAASGNCNMNGTFPCNYGTQRIGAP